MIGQTKFLRHAVGYIGVQASDFRIWINEQSNTGQPRNRLLQIGYERAGFWKVDEC